MKSYIIFLACNPYSALVVALPYPFREMGARKNSTEAGSTRHWLLVSITSLKLLDVDFL